MGFGISLVQDKDQGAFESESLACFAWSPLLSPQHMGITPHRGTSTARTHGPGENPPTEGFLQRLVMEKFLDSHGTQILGCLHDQSACRQQPAFILGAGGVRLSRFAKAPLIPGQLIFLQQLESDGFFCFSCV